MAVDGDAVDLVDAERAGRERRHGNGRGDDRIDLAEYFQERRPQAVAAVTSLDIFDATIACPLRDHIAVLVV